MSSLLLLMTFLTGLFCGGFLILALGIYLENRGWETQAPVSRPKIKANPILTTDA